MVIEWNGGVAQRLAVGWIYRQAVERSLSLGISVEGNYPVLICFGVCWS